MTKEELIEKHGIEWYEEYRKRKIEYGKKYRLEHPDCRAKEYAKAKERNPNIGKEKYRKNLEVNKARSREYYQKNKEKCLGYSAAWAKNNPEKRLEQQRKYTESHREQINEKYKNDKSVRARALARAYSRTDTKYKRGVSTLTKEWLLENVFNGQTCFYCGESDWHMLGCDRIDNTKAHTPDNVVVSCRKCNEHRARQDFNKFCKKMGVICQE